MGRSMTSHPSNIQQIQRLTFLQPETVQSVRKRFLLQSKSSSNPHPAFFILDCSAEHQHASSHHIQDTPRTHSTLDTAWTE